MKEEKVFENPDSELQKNESLFFHLKVVDIFLFMFEEFILLFTIQVVFRY